jgi:hypothetical protein
MGGINPPIHNNNNFYRRLLGRHPFNRIAVEIVG